jgi:hypothetical protein
VAFLREIVALPSCTTAVFQQETRIEKEPAGVSDFQILRQQNFDAETLLKTGENWLQLLRVLRSSRNDLPHLDAVVREAVLHGGGKARKG